MSAIGFVLEKVRHGSALSSGELKLLGDEIDRLESRFQGCAQEVARLGNTLDARHLQDRERAEKLRRAEEEVARLQDALAHARRRLQVESEGYEKAVGSLRGVMRDVGYGLRYQPELTREELAVVIEREVGAHPAPEGS